MHAAPRPNSPWLRLTAAWRLAAFAGLGLYAIFLWRYASIQPGGSDSSGYFNLARLLTEGRLHVPARTIEGLPLKDMPAFAYVPLGFRPTGDGVKITPTYPPGLSGFFAASSFVFGWELGPKLVLVLHSLAGVLLTYALARQAGARPATAALGGLLLAVSPLYVQLSVYAMSDLPAMVWCAAALWLAGRRTLSAVAGSGLAIGIAVLIRPSNVLVLLPVMLTLGLNWRRLAALAIGGAPAAVAFAWFNHAAYGSALSSGYGDVSSLFSREWVLPALAHYARWLPMTLSPLIVLALGLPWRWQHERRTVLVHGTWIAGLFGFYAFYYHTHEVWWYLRFVLPAFPSLIVAVVLVADALARRWPLRAQAFAWSLAAALALANGTFWEQRYALRHTGEGEKVYQDAIAVVRAQVPAQGVVVTMQASGALFWGAPNTLLRWDNIDDAWPKAVAGAQRAGQPLYALLFEFEEKDAFGVKTPGRWTKVQTHERFALWRYDGPSPP